jgi:hypothetical protein
MLLDEDEDPCIRLLSYCKKHRQPSAERPSLESDPAEPFQLVQTDMASSSGCARTGKRTSTIHLTRSFLMFLFAKFNCSLKEGEIVKLFSWAQFHLWCDVACLRCILCPPRVRIRFLACHQVGHRYQLECYTGPEFTSIAKMSYW